MPRRRRPRRLARGRTSVARNNSLISSKISDIEASLDRLHDRRRGVKSHRLPSKLGSLKGIGSLKGLTKSLGTGDTNIHSLVEKAANLTSRWSRTAGMVSLIGSNMKGIASPLLSNLGSLTGLLKRSGSGAGGGLAGMAGMAQAAAKAPSPSGGGGGGLDIGNLMQAAQSVLGQMSKPPVGVDED